MALSEIQSVEDICAHYLPAYRDLCGQARVLCDSKSTAKDSFPTYHLTNLENSLIETRAALQELSAICRSALCEESADEAQGAWSREIDNTIEYAYPYEILTLELTVAWTSALLASRSIVALEECMQAVALTSKGWAAVPKGLCKDSPGLPRLCVSTHKLSAKLAETIVERARYGLKINWDFSPPTKRAGSSDNLRKSKHSRAGKGSRDKFPSMTRLSTEEYDQRLASISEWLTDLHKSAEVVMATWIL